MAPKPPPTIVMAAVRVDTLIFSQPRPARHHHLMQMMTNLGIPKVGREQGFISSEGAFVARIPAAEMALGAGQVAFLIAPPRLFSEDLW